MLGQRLRLRSPRDFRRAWEQGKQWRGKFLALQVVPNGLPHSRFGFVVSSRLGKAAIRNRVKRRLRAACRQWLPPLAAGYDIVVVAHSPATQAAYQEIEAELGVLLRRAGLLMADR